MSCHMSGCHSEVNLVNKYVPERAAVRPDGYEFSQHTDVEMDA